LIAYYNRNMRSLSERLSWARAQKSIRDGVDFTQDDLATKAGVSQGSIGHLESGRTRTSRKLTAIAAALGVDAIWLAEGKGTPWPSVSPVSNVAPAATGTRKIPLVNYVQAGHMREVVDQHWVGDTAEFLLTDLDLSTGAFALSIKGDSMLPDFREGDRVIIDPEIQPLPGDFVVAKNGGEEATFKKYRTRGINEHGEMVFELIPLNDDYPSMRSDITPLAIIGTMVEHRRYRKR
jgi:SOS-response transcriptional repressor LexA